MAFRDIRRSRSFLSAADVGFILGALILLVGLLALNIYLARILSGGEWLFMRWSGIRAFLFEHVEPFGSTLAQRVQMLVYGRAAFLNEYPYALNDPFYIVLLYSPLAFFFSDFTIARGIWMLFSEAALVAIVMLSLNLIEWESPRWLLVILLGLGLFSYFSIGALLSASSTIFLTLLYLIILVALRSFSDELAGILLFLVAYQWEVGALFFLFILVFVFANRRWGVLAGFGMALVLSLVVSYLVKSDWALSYARAVLFDGYHSTEYTFGFTLANLFPALDLSINRWLAMLGGVILLFEAIRSMYEHPRHVMWAAFLALTLNPLIGFAIFSPNHVVLLPALVLLAALVCERWTNKPMLVSIFVIGLILFSYFGFYVETLNNAERIYSDALHILPPVVATLGLYWMRWWAVRPPRIWTDQFGARK